MSYAVKIKKSPNGDPSTSLGSVDSPLDRRVYRALEENASAPFEILDRRGMILALLAEKLGVQRDLAVALYKAAKFAERSGVGPNELRSIVNEMRYRSQEQFFKRFHVLIDDMRAEGKNATIWDHLASLYREFFAIGRRAQELLISIKWHSTEVQVYAIMWGHILKNSKHKVAAQELEAASTDDLYRLYWICGLPRPPINKVSNKPDANVES